MSPHRSILFLSTDILDIISPDMTQHPLTHRSKDSFFILTVSILKVVVGTVSLIFFLHNTFRTAMNYSTIENGLVFPELSNPTSKHLRSFLCFHEVMALETDDPILLNANRCFYENMCRNENWNSKNRRESNIILQVNAIGEGIS